METAIIGLITGKEVINVSNFRFWILIRLHSSATESAICLSAPIGGAKIKT